MDILQDFDAILNGHASKIEIRQFLLEKDKVIRAFILD